MTQRKKGKRTGHYYLMSNRHFNQAYIISSFTFVRSFRAVHPRVGGGSKQKSLSLPFQRKIDILGGKEIFLSLQGSIFFYFMMKKSFCKNTYRHNSSLGFIGKIEENGILFRKILCKNIYPHSRSLGFTKNRGNEILFGKISGNGILFGRIFV